MKPLLAFSITLMLFGCSTPSKMNKVELGKHMNKLEPRISIITLFVSDMKRSYRFYAEGLGFPTKHKEDDQWIAFSLNGICFCLYPYSEFDKESLPRKVDQSRALNNEDFPGITLAYNTRKKDEVIEVLKLAEQYGGKIEKLPEETFWGGYSGYFSDPDGHLWEVAWGENWEFNPDGSLIL